MEKPIFKAIAKVFKQKCVVFKGMNVSEQGTLLSEMSQKYINPVFVGIDAARFDASVDAGLLEWEHTIYTNLNKDPILKRLLRYQTWNVGTAYCPDGIVRYKMSGGRGSGDMNTSLGNCIIMCGILYTWMKRTGVKCSLANNGDDCLLIMEAGDLDAFRTGLPEFAKNLGLTLTTEEPVYNLEQAEFCQMRAIEIEPGNWRFVRNLNSSREKDSMCLIPLEDEATTRKWMYAVGECGLALCSGVPVMQEFYKAFMRNGTPSNFKNAPYFQSSLTYNGKGMEAKEESITDACRASYFMAWGVTPDEQVALEDYYKNWKFEYRLNEGDISSITLSPF